MSYIKEILSSSGHIIYSKKIAKLFGANVTVLIGELCAKQVYWQEHDGIAKNDGWFYITQEEISNDTALSPYQQRSAFLMLQQNGIIQIKKKGIPAKNWYKIDLECINTLLLKN